MGLHRHLLERAIINIQALSDLKNPPVLWLKSVLSQVDVLGVCGVFTPRNHTRCPKMAMQKSLDFIEFPRMPAGKTRDVSIFGKLPVIFSITA